MKKWIKEHKKQLIIAGSVVGAGAVGVTLWAIFRKKPVETTTTVTAFLPLYEPHCLPVGDTAVDIPLENLSTEVEKIVIDVPRYLRPLPVGQHPSERKLNEAAELGIDLLEGFTIVDSYSYPRSHKFA